MLILPPFCTNHTPRGHASSFPARRHTSSLPASVALWSSPEKEVRCPPDDTGRYRARRLREMICCCDDKNGKEETEEKSGML